jgi:hypothetical protein
MALPAAIRVSPPSGFSGSIMPKFTLKEQELNDLTRYMLSLKRES